MTFDHSRVRRTNFLVNLTKKWFSMYEDTTGKLVRFMPIKMCVLPEEPHQDARPVILYVVSPEKAVSLKKEGRELDDIAILKKVRKGSGRNGADLAVLVWGKNLKCPVRLYRAN